MARKPITVSQLNRYIGRILSTDPILGNLSVQGEISNLKYHESGHVFFSLKDAGTKVPCFLPASAAQNLRYELTDGMEAVIYGYLSVYEPGGYYSLNVKDVEVFGAGSLAAAFQAMFQKLEKEGLFDSKYKKPIPQFPKRICVITSPSGDAVRDILKIIRTRNKFVDIIIVPCLVQGKAAASDIASSISLANEKFSDADVIIVGRGGGSAEDLWAFNEEIVARSIFASEIPVISAVGHETDFSISDYAADKRAETPTAAAAMAVPDTLDMMIRCREWVTQMMRRVRRLVELRESMIESCRPEIFLRALRDRMRIAEGDVSWMRREMEQQIRALTAKLSSQTEQLRLILESENPQRIIARGYAAVKRPDGGLVTCAGNLQSGETLDIIMKDGGFSCRVEEISYERRFGQNE